MAHRSACLLGAATLAAILSLPAVAQEYSNGGHGAAGRGPAILTPVEAFGVHPPGIDPADTQHWVSRWRQRFIPYYAPVSPVASTARWKPWAYHPLFPYYTPYYLGYSPHRHSNPPPRRYGSDGWGRGPQPDSSLPDDPEDTPLDYAAYTSVIEDDTTFWNMGGNGLVPYGSSETGGARQPDLIDAIQAGRPHCRIRGHVRRAAPAGPAIVSPVETAEQQERGSDREPNSASRRRSAPAESIPPGGISE